jgi:hypothetical protein
MVSRLGVVVNHFCSSIESKKNAAWPRFFMGVMFKHRAAKKHLT